MLPRLGRECYKGTLGADSRVVFLSPPPPRPLHAPLDRSLLGVSGEAHHSGAPLDACLFCGTEVSFH